MKNETIPWRPIQLNSILLLRELKDSVIPIDRYVSNLLEDGGRDGSPEITYVDVNANFTKQEIEVIPYSDLTKLIPADQKEAVCMLHDNLLTFITSHYRLEQEELINHHYLGVIKDDSECGKKGTIVYYRNTNIADIELFFPSIIFDVATFIPAVVFDHEESNIEILDSQLQVDANPENVIINWAKGIAKGIAGKTLPKPYGDIAVAIFNLLDGLFSSSDGVEISLQQVIDELKEYIDTKFEQEKVKKQLECVQGFLVWLEDKAPSLDVPFEKLGKDYLDDFTERLKVAVGPQSDSIHVTITLLSDDQYTKNRDYFDVLILAISTYCSAVTTLINIYLLKSEHEESGKDNYLKTARNYATGFSSFIGGSKDKAGRAAFIKKLLDKKIKDVTEGAFVEYVDERHTECHRYDVGPMECHEWGNAYWQFYEDRINKKGLHRKKIKYWSTGCCSQNHHTNSDQIKAEVTRERDNFINSFKKGFEGHYEAVQEWKNAVQKIDVALEELLLDSRYA